MIYHTFEFRKIPISLTECDLVSYEWTWQDIWYHQFWKPEIMNLTAGSNSVQLKNRKLKAKLWYQNIYGRCWNMSCKHWVECFVWLKITIGRNICWRKSLLMMINCINCVDNSSILILVLSFYKTNLPSKIIGPRSWHICNRAFRK